MAVDFLESLKRLRAECSGASTACEELRLCYLQIEYAKQSISQYGKLYFKGFDDDGVPKYTDPSITKLIPLRELTNSLFFCDHESTPMTLYQRLDTIRISIYSTLLFAQRPTNSQTDLSRFLRNYKESIQKVVDITRKELGLIRHQYFLLDLANNLSTPLPCYQQLRRDIHNYDDFKAAIAADVYGTFTATLLKDYGLVRILGLDRDRVDGVAQIIKANYEQAKARQDSAAKFRLLEAIDRLVAARSFVYGFNFSSMLSSPLAEDLPRVLTRVRIQLIIAEIERIRFIPRKDYQHLRREVRSAYALEVAITVDRKGMVTEKLLSDYWLMSSIKLQPVDLETIAEKLTNNFTAASAQNDAQALERIRAAIAYFINAGYAEQILFKNNALSQSIKFTQYRVADPLARQVRVWWQGYREYHDIPILNKNKVLKLGPMPTMETIKQLCEKSAKGVLIISLQHPQETVDRDDLPLITFTGKEMVRSDADIAQINQDLNLSANGKTLTRTLVGGGLFDETAITISGNNLTVNDIDQVVIEMHEALQAGREVYVHCFSGKGRSAMICAAYLMKYTNRDPVQAMHHIHSYRNVAHTFATLSLPQQNLLSSYNSFLGHSDFDNGDRFRYLAQLLADKWAVRQEAKAASADRCSSQTEPQPEAACQITHMIT